MYAIISHWLYTFFLFVMSVVISVDWRLLLLVYYEKFVLMFRVFIHTQKPLLHYNESLS